MTIYDIEDVLVILPHLKHFELDARRYSNSLADGQRWEKITGRLATFNFIFRLTIIEVEQVLDSFRTWF